MPRTAGRSVFDECLVVSSITPRTIASNTTTDGDSVDLWGHAFDASKFQKFHSAMVVVHTGTVSDGTYTVEVQDSDDDSSFTAVADAFLQGSEPEIAATDDDTIFEIGYEGLNQFLRVSITSASKCWAPSSPPR